MKKKKTRIADCFVFETDRYYDKRGFFQELYSERTLGNFDLKFTQVNWSSSNPNVLRGIHEAKYHKLVNCLQGEIFDAVVDLRPDSKTYLKTQCFWLNHNEPKMILIPPGCGHGFFATERSMVVYLQTDVYKPGNELNWHYDSFDIKWPGRAVDYVLSEKDAQAVVYGTEQDD